ncbi:HET domain-containing protein [Xylaria flabelliformis]|nr:HET domain-containing protein [Xylaria flabelliformis]
MRLLHTNRPDTPELVEVSEEFAPKYAILSHTWGREEVTFQDIQAFGRKQWSQTVSQTVSTIRAKPGFAKIQKAAALAAEHGYDFIWVDTCCIDKTSSAELSEAINSMFRWYNKALICYAYMEDVENGSYHNKGGSFRSLCQRSRWFTRGWTLQELIAPEDVMFYGKDWGYLGSKAHDEDVRTSLAEITGIDVRVLEAIVPPSEMSIATRMKWASRRKTTRLEDAAYCLMGLFDVNMPLLYGEGTKAFIRLQGEILKGSNDHSIFTWRVPEDYYNESLSGLLAESPQQFTDVEDYRPMPPLISQESTTWSMTNQGLRLSLFLLSPRDSDDNKIQDDYYAVLECVARRGDKVYESPVIRMRRLYGDQFARVDPQVIQCLPTPHNPSHNIGSYEMIFVKQKPVYAVPDFMVSYSNILRSSEAQDPRPSCYVEEVWPKQNWDKEGAILRTTRPHSNRVTGIFRFFETSIAVTIDFAVALRQEAGGAWAVWHLQRPSTGEPIHQTALSVNGYLASTDKNVQQTSMSPDWVIHPWKKEVENPEIEVTVNEIKVHGRFYHFVKACRVRAGFSLPDKTRAAWGKIVEQDSENLKAHTATLEFL